MLSREGHRRAPEVAPPQKWNFLSSNDGTRATEATRSWPGSWEWSAQSCRSHLCKAKRILFPDLLLACIFLSAGGTTCTLSHLRETRASSLTGLSSSAPREPLSSPANGRPQVLLPPVFTASADSDPRYVLPGRVQRPITWPTCLQPRPATSSPSEVRVRPCSLPVSTPVAALARGRPSSRPCPPPLSQAPPREGSPCRSCHVAHPPWSPGSGPKH